MENFHPEGEIYGIIANPVCTEFSQLARGPMVRARDPEAGLSMVLECQRIIEEAKPKFWAIENPATGTLRRYLGKPDYVYQPWWFGSPWSKKTALWGKFNEPERKYFSWDDVPDRIPQLWIRPGRVVPTLAYQHVSAIQYIDEFQRFSDSVRTDAEFRSLCSQKFAQAFYDANKDL